MKLSTEIEETADTLGDMLTTLQDYVSNASDYVSDDEMNKLWDAYDILMEVSEAVAQDEEDWEDELE